MYTHFAFIVQFMVDAFVHMWPYLLITIPLAVAIKMSGASKYVNRALSVQPLLAIVLATLVGAFSPFCSCGVIPIVAALLIGGVPLAPVMAFWIASPSMDPEIFFLSASVLGWKLAIWRLAATLVLSLSAGLITFYVSRQGWLGTAVLRADYGIHRNRGWALLSGVRTWAQRRYAAASRLMARQWQSLAGGRNSVYTLAVDAAAGQLELPCGCGGAGTGHAGPAGDAVELIAEGAATTSGCAAEQSCTACGGAKDDSFARRLAVETWSATTMVIKFMALAFLLEALITLYVPQTWVAGLLGPDQPFVIIWAALIGVPVYTSNLAAMPLVGALLAQGMSPAAALAFLISGPTTTLPAMAAVWGLATRRVFALYVAFALFGAIVAGYAFAFVSAIWG